MYLSRLRFHSLHSEARHTLQTPYHLHAAVMSGFPNHKNTPDSRILFRQEPVQRFSPWADVLVQSQMPADWRRLEETLGQALLQEQKEVQLAVGKDQYLRFRLRANPVVTKAGKRRPVTDELEQRIWLEQRAAKHGFAVRECTLIDEGTWQTTKKNDDGKIFIITVNTVLYDGLLLVDDSSRFKLALAAGIGPAKGFGCGLLSVARA